MQIGNKQKEWTPKAVRAAREGCAFLFWKRVHPENTTDKGAVKSVRRFLENAGIEI